MKIENLPTLKIHKLTREQYERELANGNIDTNAIYLTPDDDNDNNKQELITEITESATDEQLPTAKAVYDYINENRLCYEETGGSYTALMEDEPVFFRNSELSTYNDNYETVFDDEPFYSKVAEIINNNLGNTLTVRIKNLDGTLYTEHSAPVVEVAGEKSGTELILGNVFHTYGSYDRYIEGGAENGADIYIASNASGHGFYIRKDYKVIFTDDGTDIETVEYDEDFLNGGYFVDILVGDTSTTIKKLDTKFINTSLDINENCTDNEIPTAKAVYDLVQKAIQEALYVDKGATI